MIEVTIEETMWLLHFLDHLCCLQKNSVHLRTEHFSALIKPLQYTICVGIELLG